MKKNDVIKLSGKMIEVQLSNNYIERKANEVLNIIKLNIEKNHLNKNDVTLQYIGDLTHSIMIDRFGTPHSYKEVMEVSKRVWWKLAEEEFKKLKKEDEL